MEQRVLGLWSAYASEGVCRLAANVAVVVVECCGKCGRGVLCPSADAGQCYGGVAPKELIVVR